MTVRFFFSIGTGIIPLHTLMVSARCAGVVPQQPPIIQAPSITISSISFANSSGFTSYTVCPFTFFWQTCIWIHNNRRGAAGCQLFHKRFHLCWTKSAVKADSIYAKPSSNATAAGISPPVSSFAFSSKVMVTNTGNFVFSFYRQYSCFLLHVYHSWFQSELHRLLLARPP